MRVSAHPDTPVAIGTVGPGRGSTSRSNSRRAQTNAFRKSCFMVTICDSGRAVQEARPGQTRGRHPNGRIGLPVSTSLKAGRLCSRFSAETDRGFPNSRNMLRERYGPSGAVAGIQPGADTPCDVPGLPFDRAGAGARAVSGRTSDRLTDQGIGAGDGNRTHDIQLGKLTFYL
jgi:hypothetical protein